VLAIAGTAVLQRVLLEGHDHRARRRVPLARTITRRRQERLVLGFFASADVIAYVTAFYMMRCWTLTFWGKPRNQHLYDHAHETPVMWIPLVALAFLSIIGGRFLNVRDMLEATQRETKNYCNFDAYATAWPRSRRPRRSWEIMKAPRRPRGRPARRRHRSKRSSRRALGPQPGFSGRSSSASAWAS
jgi:hypothetical protein